MTAPTQHTATAGGNTPGRPARPAGYWERIDRIVASAPPLTQDQRARLRVIFHGSTDRRKAA